MGLSGRRRTAKLARLGRWMSQLGAVNLTLGGRPAGPLQRSAKAVAKSRNRVTGVPFAPGLVWRSAERLPGQVPEWSIGHAWRACVLVTVPRVRIPPCPRLIWNQRVALYPGVLTARIPKGKVEALAHRSQPSSGSSRFEKSPGVLLGHRFPSPACRDAVAAASGAGLLECAFQRRVPVGCLPVQFPSAIRLRSLSAGAPGDGGIGRSL